MHKAQNLALNNLKDGRETKEKQSQAINKFQRNAIYDKIFQEGAGWQVPVPITPWTLCSLLLNPLALACCFAKEAESESNWFLLTQRSYSDS